MEQLSIFDFTPEAKQRRRDAYQKLREIADKLDSDGLNVLSLYNGISCGRVALDRAGIKVARYVSYEIDDNANLIAKTNYPDDEYYGDVTTADFTQYKGFDLVIGGSPCTYWSIAKQGRETTPDGEGGDCFSTTRELLRSPSVNFSYMRITIQSTTQSRRLFPTV